MALNPELVSKLVKVTNDRGRDNQNFTVYGTVTNDGDRNYVKMDGSELSTPIETTVEINEGDRVIVEVKNHTATVTGNTSNPAVGVKTANGLRSEISQTADKIRLEVSDEVNKLESSIELTAKEIRSEVTAEVANVNTNINGLDTRITNAESAITQTATEIRSEVKAEFDSVEGQLSDVSSDINGLTGRITKAESNISQTATEIRSEVKASFDTVNGEIDEFSIFKQTVEGFSFMNKGGTVKISGGDINLTGAIKFSDLTDSSTIQNQINTASSNASDAIDIAESADSTADRVLTTVNGITIKEDSKTYLDGEMLYTKSVYANAMHLGGELTVYDSLYSDTVGGYLGYCEGFNSNTGIGVMNSVDTGQCICTDLAARLSYGGDSSIVVGPGSVTIKTEADDGIQFSVDGYQQLYVGNNIFGTYASRDMDLGKSSIPWNTLYASTCTGTTSDRNKKNSIENLPAKYIQLFDNLQPRRFKMNRGTSGRYHTGYIAQEVEEAMLAAGVSGVEFAGFIKDKDDQGNDVFMLRYGEFDAIYAAKIKQLEDRYEAKFKQLEDRIATLEEQLEAK